MRRWSEGWTILSRGNGEIAGSNLVTKESCRLNFAHEFATKQRKINETAGMIALSCYQKYYCTETALAARRSRQPAILGIFRCLLGDCRDVHCHVVACRRKATNGQKTPQYLTSHNVLPSIKKCRQSYTLATLQCTAVSLTIHETPDKTALHSCSAIK